MCFGGYDMDKEKKEQELHIGHRKRIKERYTNRGIASLDDFDVLELILTYAIPRRDVYVLARDLIEAFDSLENILDAPVSKLREKGKLTDHTIILLKLIKDMKTRPSTSLRSKRHQLSSVIKAIDFCRSIFKNISDEAVFEIMLDADNYVVDVVKLTQGTDDTAVAPLDYIIANLYRYNVSRVIITHNHPSGNSKPSASDITTTNILLEAFKKRDIELAEHIIVTREDCTAILHNQTISIPINQPFTPWRNA